jgi:acetyl-CoA synthetase
VDPRDPQWLPGAVYNIVASCLDHGDDAPAIYLGLEDAFSVLSVAELRTEVAAFAAGFTQAGFSPGDAIAIVMPMTVEAVVAYLGTIAAGGVVVAIADSFAPHEIRTRFEITRPVAVVTQDVSVRLGRTLPMYTKCIDAGAPTTIVVDTGSGVERRGGDLVWGDFMVHGASFAPHMQEADAVTNILFSSASSISSSRPVSRCSGSYPRSFRRGDLPARSSEVTGPRYASSLPPGRHRMPTTTGG